MLSAVVEAQTEAQHVVVVVAPVLHVPVVAGASVVAVAVMLVVAVVAVSGRVAGRASWLKFERRVVVAGARQAAPPAGSRQLVAVVELDDEPLGGRLSPVDCRTGQPMLAERSPAAPSGRRSCVPTAAVPSRSLAPLGRRSVAALDGRRRAPVALAAGRQLDSGHQSWRLLVGVGAFGWRTIGSSSSRWRSRRTVRFAGRTLDDAAH